MDRSYSGTVAADGTAVINITPNDGGLWIVRQVSGEMPSALSGATCTITKDGVYVASLVAKRGTAGGDPPVELWPGNNLRVRWTGGVSGQPVSAFIIFDRGRG